jgi:hypothetical protein
VRADAPAREPPGLGVSRGDLLWSVALGYVLFVLWPDAYVALGYEPLLTAQLVVAVINIHHFVVDAYIWRLRRDPNLRTVVDQPVPAEA